MNDISCALLAWYDRHARILPWRGISDPYRTWVSEIMLQQTRVDTVIPYYERFLSRFPSIADLAAADEEEVLKLWQGLGYYSRARNLLLGVRQVMEEKGGVIPSDPKELEKITGIGAYTAGAIASIAYGVRVPAVDGNVIRVLSRLYGIRSDASAPETRRRIFSLADDLVPPERPGDHNQAVMDLGAVICVPGTPDCRACPLAAFCDARSRGDAADLPFLPGAKPPRQLPWTVLLVLSGNRVLARKRTEKMLNGLWCFPMLPGFLSEAELKEKIPDDLHPESVILRKEREARHVFTHQVWQMRLWTCRVPSDVPAPRGYQFLEPGPVRDVPWPAAMYAALDCLQAFSIKA